MMRSELASPELRESAQDRPLSLHALRLALIRRLPLLALTFLAAALLVFAGFMLQPKTYTAGAALMIDPDRTRIVGAEQSLRDLQPNSTVVDTEIEVLRSGRFAPQVVEALRLQPGWSRQSPGDTPPAPAPGLSAEAQAAAAAREVRGALSIERRALSFVIDVRIEARDPDRAAAVANAYVEAYLQAQRSDRESTGARASAWLTERITALRAELEAKEAAAEAFRQRAGLLTAAGQSLTESEINDVQQSVLAARTDLAASQARYAQIQSLLQSRGSGDTMADALNSQVIRDLRSQEAELSRRQAEYEATLGPRHPFIASGRAELESVRAQMASELSRISEQMRNELDVSRARLATLEGSLGRARAELSGENDALVRLRQMERDAIATRAVYESFLQRQQEIEGQGRMAEFAARWVSQAEAPLIPSSPRPLLALIVALVAGGVATLCAWLVSASLNDSIVTADEAEPRLGIPTLVSVPAIKAQTLRLLSPDDRHPPGYLLDKPLSAFAESMRLLHTTILNAPGEEDLDGVVGERRVVAITSALPGEGKTSVALSLARAAAMNGQSVILVDGDLRMRSVNRYLRIAPRQGLVQVLAGQAEWRDVTGYDEPSGAHILPLADVAAPTIDVFNTPAMRALVEELRAAYDLVILDAAPVLAAAHVRSLVAHADFTVLVARSGKSTVHASASALEQLRRSGAQVLGLALNHVDPRIPGWGSYSDPLYYGRGGYAYDIA